MIKLSKWTVGRYLANWGFSPQKPARQAIEQNPKAIEKWFKIEYPMIQKLARKDNATIHWGDEMGLRSDHNVGRTYGLKGITPIVKRTGNRFSCNIISTITNLGKLTFMVFHENFTSEIFLQFLKRLVRQSNRKVFLIVDNHRSHKSKMVNKWLTDNVDRINVYYLPSYCPELNPDEFLNQDVKSHLGKQRLHTKAQMLKTLNSHLKMRQKAEYEILDSDQLTVSDVLRLVELYNNVYLKKHSMLNPQFTVAFVQMVLESKLWSFKALRKNNVIEGVFGYFCCNGVMISPFFGYDKNLENHLDIYRLLSTIMLLEAKEKGLILHQSAGASFYKKIRRASECLEYNGIYSAHLPFYRRFTWGALDCFINNIGVHFMKKY